MKKFLIISAFLCGTTLFATEVQKVERKPNQLSDVTHEFECTGKTKKGVVIAVSGKTDIFFNLKERVSLKFGPIEPSFPETSSFGYNSTHIAKDKAKHSNIVMVIRGADMMRLNLVYAQGSKNNKLEAQDWDNDEQPLHKAVPSSVFCKGRQIGSYD